MRRKLLASLSNSRRAPVYRQAFEVQRRSVGVVRRRRGRRRREAFATNLDLGFAGLRRGQSRLWARLNELENVLGFGAVIKHLVKAIGRHKFDAKRHCQRFSRLENDFTGRQILRRDCRELHVTSRGMPGVPFYVPASI